VVFPVPRGPQKRYAWAGVPALTALRSVVVIGSCPTTSANDCGRQRR
jgi:hypothetical protein